MKTRPLQHAKRERSRESLKVPLLSPHARSEAYIPQRGKLRRRERESAAALLERVDSRQRTPDRKLVNRLGAFVSDDAFEVEHVADRDELRADAGAT
jgi:hypothetical protein